MKGKLYSSRLTALLAGAAGIVYGSMPWVALTAQEEDVDDPAVAEPEETVEEAVSESAEGETVAEEPGGSGEAAPAVDVVDLQSQVRGVVERCSPAVVAIMAEGGGGSGSGVIINSEGLILTAAHVTEATGKDVEIRLSDGRSLEGKALGADYERDAAVVKIVEPGEYPYCEMLEDHREIHEGDWAVAIGHPGGWDSERSAPIRLGRIQKRARFVVTDATLSGGDSGGPLFDLEGRVIGIHSSIGPNVAQNAHVRIDAYHRSWDRLVAGDEWGTLSPKGLFAPEEAQGQNRAIIGALLSRPESGAVTVEGIGPDGPAAEAGLEADDQIIEVEGFEIDGYGSLVDLLAEKEPGDNLSLKVRRGDETMEFTLELGDRRDLGP